MFKGIVKDQAFSFFPSSFRFRSHADIATLLAALWYLGPISGSCACKSRQYKQSEDVIMIDAETGHVLRYRLLANAWYDICSLLYIYNWNLYSSFIYVSMVYANVYTYIFTYYTYWLYLHRYYFICRAIEIQRGLKFEEPLADHTLFVATVNWCKLLVQQICSQSCDMFLTFRITLWDWRERERERERIKKEPELPHKNPTQNFTPWPFRFASQFCLKHNAVPSKYFQLTKLL